MPMPTTSLNIGMDLWNASPSGGTPMKTRPESSGASPQVASAIIVGREGHSHLVIFLDSVDAVFILYNFYNLSINFFGSKSFFAIFIF